jgi:glycosyltransferase involved in cell wall biosynthesis
VDCQDWREAVVICAANSWDAPVRLHDRQLAEHLSAHVPVLYVDPPLSIAEARRVAPAASLHRLSKSLVRLTLLAPPFPLRPPMAPFVAALVRGAVGAALRRLGGWPARALVATSPLLPVFGAARERTRVWWAQDDLAAGAGLLGVSAGRLARGEAREGARAGLIVAANPVLAEAWARRGRAAELIPYGCDAEAFAATSEAPLPNDVDLRGPVAGFVGHVGDRIDLALLDAVAARGRSLLLVGPRHPRFEADRLGALLARPNVRWVGPKRFEDLPSYLRAIDVGLVPYTRSGFNLASFPLKTLEYLAAGRPVVATDLPAHRWLATDLIAIANEPEPFADLVDAALRSPAGPELIARRRRFAAEHSWAQRARAFAGALEAAA